MKRFKYETLLTMSGGGAPGPQLSSVPCRVVLIGRNDESGRSQLFSALVSCDDDAPSWPGSRRIPAIVRLSGDDVPEYVSEGGRFELWLGDVVGEGVVIRRLFI